MKYLKERKRKSLQVNDLSSATKTRERKELQKKCWKLVQDLPKTSTDKRGFELKDLPMQERWKAVSKLAQESLGEVVLLQPDTARWNLIEASHKNYLAEEYLPRQFACNQNGYQQDFASSWLSPIAKQDIDSMASRIASEKHIDKSALMPCWKEQVMRVVAPVSDPKHVWPPMEWRLYGNITTMGELLLQLGDTKDFSVAC